jgi:hypothetical protein
LLTAHNVPGVAASDTFTAEELALVQPEVFGSRDYRASFGRRALVEGYFGVAKTTGGLRTYNVRFHHHGKVALAYAFIFAATNLHLVGTWRKRRSLGAKAATSGPKKPRRTRGTNQQLSQRAKRAATTATESPPPKLEPGQRSHILE